MVYLLVVTQRSSPICGKERCVTAQKRGCVVDYKITEVVESVVDGLSSCYNIMTRNELQFA